MNSPSRQRGAIVIVAMLVLALAATAASIALLHQDASVRSLEAARDYEQARWFLRGGAHWARTILAEDARSSALDHAGEVWASGLPVTEVDRGTVSGRIDDQQGLFNLANLVRDGKPSEREVAALRRLLAALELNAELADAIAGSPPASEIEELYRVPGCDEAMVARLRPFATVLPRPTPINVNTAPPQVLMAAVDGLTLAEALVMASGRKEAPIRDVADFGARLPRANLRVNPEQITVQSRFFLVQGRAKVGRAEARLQALLQREGTALPLVLWQRLS